MHNNHILHHDATVKATMNKPLHNSGLKDTLKAFKNFRHKQQKCMKQNFLTYKSIYVLKVYSVHYTLRQNTNMGKTLHKNALFFLSRAPTHHSFTFNSQFLYGLKHKVHPSKSACGIFHFRFCLVFIKVYIFVQQKTWTL